MLAVSVPRVEKKGVFGQHFSELRLSCFSALLWGIAPWPLLVSAKLKSFSRWETAR
ncbi:hypothetical protein [Blastopirellula retiformator]|uniref:hypothetical protein n=1 Tax=Blastopirellula retiformator TaxID=2527970 RepID=UPI001646067F|nr:hypothetical protein [Blastopirellula retiformator]